MAKGDFADSKDSDKRQISLQKAEKPQVNMLIYSMREEANGIFYSCGLSNDDRKKYNTVSNKSEAHFVKRRNPIYERRISICVDRKKENL